MNYGNYFTKQWKKKAHKAKMSYTKKKHIGTLSRISLFTDFFINTTFDIYIAATLWDFSYFILLI